MINLKIVSQVVVGGVPGPVGKSAYQIAVDNGFEGTESEWLKELHPFKGWFDDVSALEETHPTPSVGEYAYVKGATSSDPVKIYECSTEGSWSDSARTVDTSTVQTFRSGEAVNEVDITNDSSDIEENSDKIPTAGAVADVLGNAEFSTGEKIKNVGIDSEPTAGSDNLVKSGGVKEFVEESQKKIRLEEDLTSQFTFTPQRYIVSGPNPFGYKIGSVIPASLQTTQASGYTTIGLYSKIRITLQHGPTDMFGGLCFYDDSNNVVSPVLMNTGESVSMKESIIDVPIGATSVRTTKTTATGEPFYCYGIVEKEVEKTLESDNGYFIGRDNTYSIGTILRNVKPGYTYRVNIKNPNFLRTDVDVPSNSYIFNVNSVYNNVSTVIIGTLNDGSSILQTYEFTIPNNCDYIRIGGRANEGEIVYYSIIEIPPLELPTGDKLVVPLGTYINANNVARRLEIPANCVQFMQVTGTIAGKFVSTTYISYDNFEADSPNHVLYGLFIVYDGTNITLKCIANTKGYNNILTKGEEVKLIAHIYVRWTAPSSAASTNRIVAVEKIISDGICSIDGIPCDPQPYSLTKTFLSETISPYSGEVAFTNGVLEGTHGLRVEQTAYIPLRLVSTFIPVNGDFKITITPTSTFKHNIYFYKEPRYDSFERNAGVWFENDEAIYNYSGYIVLLLAYLDGTTEISPSDVIVNISPISTPIEKATSEENLVLAQSIGELVADNVKGVFRATANIVIFYNNTSYVIPADYETPQNHPNNYYLYCLCFNYDTLELEQIRWSAEKVYPILATFIVDTSTKVLKFNASNIPCTVLNGNTQTYFGEPIKLNLFNVYPYKKIDTNIKQGQCVATYGKYALYLRNTNQTAYLYDTETWLELKSFSIPNGGYTAPHCNTGCVGVEFNSADSIMPLIYVSQWELNAERACFVYDVSYVNDDYVLTLVQRINLASVTVLGTGQCDFCVDTDNKLLYAIAYQTPNTDTTTHGTATIVAKMNLPLKSAGSEVFITDSDILTYNTLDEHIKVRQDLFYNNGKAYINHGLPTSPYNIPPDVAVLDLENHKIVSHIPISKIYNIEPETIDIYNGKDILITMYNQNYLYKIDI